MTKRATATTLNIALRPTSFEDVIGLETEIAAVRRLIEANTLPRAFLLSGPFGCGKTTLAYLIARAVQGPGIEDPSIQEINAASVTGIDAIRELIDRAEMRPLSGQYAVVILDEAQKLSKPAQEALLKAFESPTSPTIWIICTTDPGKLIEGLRAGRCFPLVLRGLKAEEQRRLVDRAAKAVGHDGDIEEFLAAITKAGVTSPRRILMAFDAFHAGLPTRDAIGASLFEILPEYWEIGFGVVFGSWAAPYTLPWIQGKDGKPRQFPAVCDQIKALDTLLKKTPGDADDPDLQDRPEVAHALRAITASLLKGQIARPAAKFNGPKARLAGEGLQMLGNCIGANAYGLEFALVVGALFRVNQKLQGSL